MRMVQLTKQEKENILENLLKRSPNQYDEYQEAVNEILENVKKEGDKAVFDYTKRFDKANISKETLYVTEDEIKEAYSLVDADLIETMKKSIANIRDFHERQVRNSWFHTREDGVILGQRVRGLERVGLYVPGGTRSFLARGRWDERWLDSARFRHGRIKIRNPAFLGRRAVHPWRGGKSGRSVHDCRGIH